MTIKCYVQAATPDKEVLQALFDNLDLLQQHQDLILSNPKFYIFKPFLCAWENCCYCGNTRLGNKETPIFIALPEAFFREAIPQDIGAKSKVLPTNIRQPSESKSARQYLSAAPVVRFMTNINRHRFPFPSFKPQI